MQIKCNRRTGSTIFIERLRPNSITLSGSRLAREQICDQLASWSHRRRPASEQDSVMEYGLNRPATRFELSRHVEIVQTCLRQVGKQVCDQVFHLHSVIEFRLKQVADQLANCSRAGLRPTSQLDSVMEFGLYSDSLQVVEQRVIHGTCFKRYCLVAISETGIYHFKRTSLIFINFLQAGALFLHLPWVRHCDDLASADCSAGGLVCTPANGRFQ